MKTPFKFKKFQREDLSRAAIHDGLILAWDPGCGKSLAGIAWALIKVGWNNNKGCDPLKPVLIVAPGNLHRQWVKEANDKFKIDLELEISIW